MAILEDNWLLSKKEIQTERYDICMRCAELALGTCKVCGCIVKLKVKVRTTDCPLKKWTKKEDIKYGN